MISYIKSHPKKSVLTVLQAFFATLAICSDKSVVVTEISHFQSFLSPCTGILPIVIFLGLLCFLFKTEKQLCLNKKQKIISSVLSVLFSLLWTVGYSLKIADTLIYWGFKGLYSKAIYFSLIIGLFTVFYATVKWIIFFLCVNDATNNTLSRADVKRSFFGVFLCCVGVWGLYYILFFPGVASWDSYYQINQSLGFVPLTNENPFLHTLLLSIFFKPIFATTGKIELGIAAFILFQMIVIALIVAFAYITLIKLKVNLTIRRLFLLFYVALPLVSVYSVTMWKDIWIATFTMLLSILLVRYIYLGERSWKTCFALGLACFGLLASKGTGIILVVFALAGLIFSLKKNWYKVLIPFGIAIICFFSIQAVAINQFGVIPGHIRETKSMFLQQIARVVTYHGDELTEYEKNTINEILPYDRLPELYSPTLSDNVKSEMNEQQYESNPQKYISLWVDLGLKYPVTYFNSIASNSYGYWYPDTEYWTVSSGSYREILKMYQENGWTIYDPEINNYDLSDEAMNSREKLGKLFEAAKKLPVVSFFSSIGLYFWCCLIMLVTAVYKKDTRILPLLFITLGVFVCCILSPVFAEMRYAYPAVFIFPLIVALFKIPNPHGAK